MHTVCVLAASVERIVMKTAGLDISTCTGMALVGDEEQAKVIHLPKQRGMERLHSIAADVKQTLKDWSPELVVLEGYAYTKNVSSFIILVEVGTVIRMVLHDLGLPWFEVPVPVLKQWTTGKGNAPKEVMAMHVMQRWLFKHPSNDIIDAYALAQMGQMGAEELAKISGVFFERR
jgi:crossover junction endodeoxyribonuclease RuvC